MRRLLLIFVVISVSSLAVQAQVATVRLTAEDTHTIKEIVLKDMQTRKPVAGDYKIGDQAPAGVELQAFPPAVADKVSAVKSHRFFVSGEKIVVVDNDNRIAEIIE